MENKNIFKIDKITYKKLFIPGFYSYKTRGNGNFLIFLSLYEYDFLLFFLTLFMIFLVNKEMISFYNFFYFLLIFLFNLLVFISWYEIGYFFNDLYATKFEKIPAIRAKFDGLNEEMIKKITFDYVIERIGFIIILYIFINIFSISKLIIFLYLLVQLIYIIHNSILARSILFIRCISFFFLRFLRYFIILSPIFIYLSSPFKIFLIFLIFLGSMLHLDHYIRKKMNFLYPLKYWDYLPFGLFNDLKYIIMIIFTSILSNFLGLFSTKVSFLINIFVVFFYLLIIFYRVIIKKFIIKFLIKRE